MNTIEKKNGSRVLCRYCRSLLAFVLAAARSPSDRMANITQIQRYCVALTANINRWKNSSDHVQRSVYLHSALHASLTLRELFRQAVLPEAMNSMLEGAIGIIEERILLNGK